MTYFVALLFNNKKRWFTFEQCLLEKKTCLFIGTPFNIFIFNIYYAMRWYIRANIRPESCDGCKDYILI